MFVVFIIMLYVPGDDDVMLNQKYIVSLPLTIYPVVFVQLRTLLAFAKSDSVALVPFVPAVNMSCDGSVIFTDVMFASCPALVLFTEMFKIVWIVSLVLKDEPPLDVVIVWAASAIDTRRIIVDVSIKNFFPSSLMCYYNILFINVFIFFWNF